MLNLTGYVNVTGYLTVQTLSKSETLLTSLFFPFSDYVAAAAAAAAAAVPRATWCHGSLSGASGIVSSPAAPNPHWSLHYVPLGRAAKTQERETALTSLKHSTSVRKNGHFQYSRNRL